MNASTIITLSVFVVSLATTLFAIGRLVGRMTDRLEALQAAFNAFATTIEAKVSATHDQVLTITARCPMCYERTPTPVRGYPL